MKQSIQRALYFGELHPRITPPDYLLKLLAEAKGEKYANETLYAQYQDAFYTFGRISILEVKPDINAMLGFICFPSLHEEDLRALYKVTPVGRITKDGNALAIPRVPRYVAFKLGATNLSDAMYIDMKECNTKEILTICPSSYIHSQKTPQCDIRFINSSACVYDMYRIPPRSERFFQSATRVGSRWYVATNAKEYQVNL